MLNAFALTVASVFVAMQLNWWAARWTERFLCWWHMPRCAICGEKCRHLNMIPGPDRRIKPTPLCGLHMEESIEMHMRQAKADRDAEDTEGEEWKNR